MGKIKNTFEAIGGRKFIAFLISCILLWFGKISGELWVVCFSVFCGANVGQKIGLSFKKKENENEC